MSCHAIGTEGGCWRRLPSATAKRQTLPSAQRSLLRAPGTPTHRCRSSSSFFLIVFVVVDIVIVIVFILIIIVIIAVFFIVIIVAAVVVIVDIIIIIIFIILAIVLRADRIAVSFVRRSAGVTGASTQDGFKQPARI
ncbi:unnamed protein product [Boreogadus saida]